MARNCARFIRISLTISKSFRKFENQKFVVPVTSECDIPLMNKRKTKEKKHQNNQMNAISLLFVDADALFLYPIKKSMIIQLFCIPVHCAPKNNRQFVI